MTGLAAPSPIGAPIGAFIEYGLFKTLAKWRARLLSALRRTAADPVRTRYGVLMRANWRDRTFQYCYHATYGRVLADYLTDQRRPFSFVDIGANQGLYSLIAAANPHCRTVTAFEPVAATFARLADNIALNGDSEKVCAVDAAVSLESGTATIATDAAHSGTASLRHGGAGGETIRILGIADVDAAIDERFPLVVKVDVEGHEETVIEALAASTHLPRIAAIFYEVDRRWTDAAAIEARLRGAGFARFTRYGFGRHYDVLAERAS